MRIQARSVRHQYGFTLVELMISCTLGLVIMLAGMSLLLASKSSYTTLDEQVAMQETGHYALAIITRAVRQASWVEWSEGHKPANHASVIGLDARSLRMSSKNIENPISAVSHSSDVLALRFGGAADRSISNCAGFGVAKADEMTQGWSIFFIGGERNGEPELRCKYRGKTSWRTEGIARGVESFQVLYGIDTDADGLPNQFLNASRIAQFNEEIAVGEEEQDEETKKDYWQKVVAIKIALLVRSGRDLNNINAGQKHHLFGEVYSAVQGASDRGTLIRETDIPAASRLRLRRVFSTTIPLRNAFPEGER